MYAVIETGGKQIKAEAGRYIDVEKLPNKEGDSITIEDILMIVSEDDSTIGTPTVPGAKINAKVVKHDKADKIIVYKMRPKKGTRKKQGHRQQFTRLMVESIELDGKKLA